MYEIYETHKENISTHMYNSHKHISPSIACIWNSKRQVYYIGINRVAAKGNKGNAWKTSKKTDDKSTVAQAIVQYTKNRQIKTDRDGKTTKNPTLTVFFFFSFQSC